MTSSLKIDDDLRAHIISRPSVILDDRDVMRALIGANEAAMGTNIVDMRGIAMERLERRLDRLEDTHRSVIAASYENLTGTNLVHRAILRMLDAADLDDFLDRLDTEITEILRIDAIRLILEIDAPASEGAGGNCPDLPLVGVAPGFITRYLTESRMGGMRSVTLRQVAQGADEIYGPMPAEIRSEACLLLDLGAQNRPGMLALGAKDPQLFSPQQGTDLLAFLGGVVERRLRSWLA